ncbi:hypothetical protein A2U01_0063346, partial [Trifolium medium]|nr:hypothetical protein [Trifolium medium]
NDDRLMMIGGRMEWMVGVGRKVMCTIDNITALAEIAWRRSRWKALSLAMERSTLRQQFLHNMVRI